MNSEARTLFNTIGQHITTPDQRDSFHALLSAFLRADGHPRPAHASGKSQASLSRFLNTYDWNARSIIRTTRSAIRERVEHIAQQRRGRKRVLEVIIDGTCLAKTGRFPALDIHQLKDKIGLHLVVLYVHVAGERFPWAFRVWRGKGSPTQVQLALKLLALLPAAWRSWFRVRVLADNAFGSSAFLHGVRRLGLHAVVGVNGTRHTSEGVPVSSLKCRGVRVRLRGCTVPVVVSWFRLERARGEFVWRHVVSTEAASGEVIKRWGRSRWRIEGFFKTMKSRFGLDQFGQRTRRGALRFLLLGLVAFVLSCWTALAAGVGVWVDWRAVALEARDALLAGWLLVEARARVRQLEARLEESWGA